MQKRMLALFLALVFASSAFGAYVEIGNAASTSNSSFVPSTGLYNYGWSGVIYKASEIGNAHLLNAVSYDVYNTPSSYTLSNQQIYMWHTADSVWTNVYPDPVTNGYDLVFDGDVLFDGSGWVNINLQTPFDYNGTDNLVVFWENHDGAWLTGYPSFRYTSTTNAAICDYQDASFPNSPALSAYKANIRLHWQDANDPTSPTNIVPADGATNVALSGNCTWTWGANNTSYDLWFGPTGSMAQVVTGMPIFSSTGGYVYTDLDGSTEYKWKIVVYNSEGGQLSTDVMSFTTEPDPYMLDAAIEFDKSYAWPNTNTTYKVTINNVGTMSDTYDLTVGTGYVWPTAWVDGASVTVPAGGTYDAIVNVSVPADTTIADTSFATITVTSQHDAAVTASFDTETVWVFGPTSGGSDLQGYNWTNSFDPAGPTFDWIEPVTRTEFPALPTDDSMVGPFPIGFDFPFYGVNSVMQDSVYFCSNGYLSFDGTYVFSNTHLPNADTYNNIIAWFWDDLDPEDNPDGDTHVYYETRTVNAMDACVFTMENYHAFPGGNPGKLSAQVILFENGDIKMQYKGFGGNMPMEEAVIGLENEDGTVGVEYEYYQNCTASGMAIYFEKFVPTNPIFAVNPVAVDFGIVPLGTQESETITVSNMGSGALGISSVNLVTAFGTSYSLVDGNTYPLSLGNMQAITFDIEFDPQENMVMDAIIRITDNTRTVHDVPVVGQGMDLGFWFEDFDGGTLPTGWVQDTGDQRDWTIDAGGTTSSGTGPSVDHTTGTTAGYYMYYETSTPVAPGDVANLLTPTVNITGHDNPTLRFFYNMYGSSMGTLSVDVYDGHEWYNDQWTMSGDHGDVWLEANVFLAPFLAAGDIQVRFRGICGSSWASDMAIDDVCFYNPPCGSVNGYVQEAGARAPIAGATVLLGDMNATTGADGYYTFPYVLAGTYDMTVTHPLYLDATVTGIVVADGVATAQDIDMYWAELDIDVAEFDVNVMPGNSVTEQLVITNNGPADLEYAIGPEFAAATRGFASIPAASEDFLHGTDALSTDRSPYAASLLQASSQVTETTRNWNVTVWNAHQDEIVQYPIDNPGSFTDILACSYSLFAGDWAPGSLTDMYALDYDTNTLYKLDMSTLTATSVGVVTPDSLSWTGMASNPFTGRIYACTARDLYELDVTAPSISHIGQVPDGQGRLIDMAIGPDGLLYGHDLNNDRIVIVSTTDASVTPVGSTGFDANYAQGMFTDWVTGQVYLNAYNNANSTGELRRVDLTTGATELIGAFEGGAEICAGGVPSTMWVTSSPAVGIVPANGGMVTVDVTFNASDLTSGDVKTGNLVVYNNSNYVAGRGDDYLIPFTMTVAALLPPANVKISITGTNAVLTWDAVMGATSYHVYYATDPNGAWNEIPGSPVTGTTATHTGAGAAATKYFYRVTAANTAR